MPYRFYAGSLMTDLIPFGGMEEDGQEVILDDPRMELSVLGTSAVLQDATVSAGNFKIVTLPGLCIMKLVAFGEKPDMRAKDWSDFQSLLNHYGDIAGEELFVGPHDGLLTDDMELPLASARMLGRQIAAILKKTQRSRKPC